ncbi:hypothetical protein SI65_04317 [Aspergillus cristatus]|uniref:Uncharacterized protein n=1 Tax=Aspergillus cristatus TaxID=573508 RepID=A0A1E3BJY6_ASPCR|nr:hypothetical protein SI65_04317 [Aspergillus cristatus]
MINGRLYRWIERKRQQHCYCGTCKTKIFCGHKKLPNHEVFDAEARGALLGL